jgi:hypothetical protein
MKNLRHLMAAALVAAAAPASAQVLLAEVSTNVPLAAVLDNPCTPEAEAIAFSGATALRQRVWLLPSGNLRLQLSESTTLNGSAALSAAAYAVSGASEKDLEFDPVGFSILQFKKVQQQGVTDNFHSVLVMAFDPQSLKLDLKLEGACDNGMP